MKKMNIVNKVTVKSLKIGYGPQSLLPPLSASASPGELVAVIGRNGIGKSTLLRTLQGLQASLGGDVLIDGKKIPEFTRIQLARKIGYISTEIIRVSNMRVCDLVTLGRFPHTNWIGQTDNEDNLAIKKAIRKTGLENLENRYISELSDGERQRAMIARALAQETEILVMDEPTAFLDVISKYEIVNLMKELTSEGRTVIFSTHDFNIALNQADKIWLMLDDNLVEGAPEDLILAGTFNQLFGSDVVEFNKGDGTFIFKTRFRGNLHIEGHGLMRYWTEKALERRGYSTKTEEKIPEIKVPAKKDDKWIIYTEDLSVSFGSLYEMLRHLDEYIT